MRQLFILLILVAFSCKNNAPTLPILTSCSQLEQQVRQLKSNLNSQYRGYIGHDIYLKLKDLNDMSTVISALNRLCNIEGVEALKVGPFKNLGDQLALKYDIKMQMYINPNYAKETTRTYVK